MNAKNEEISKFCTSFNFGPYSYSNKTVETLVNEVLLHWKGSWKYNKEKAVHEAFLLNLNIDKATQILNWNPVWDFSTTIKKTIEWYKFSNEYPDKIKELTTQQIESYSKGFIEKVNI